MKNKVLIIIGAAVYNKGSEALLTGVVKMCKEAGASSVVVSSGDLRHKHELEIEGISYSIPRYNSFYHNKNIKRLSYKLKQIFNCSDIVTKIISGNLLKRVSEFDLIIIVGADNLDNKVNYKRELYSLTEIIKKKSNAKLFLYDCSIDESNIDSKLIENLYCYDAISARDITSFNNLKSLYKKDNLYYFPDPAFVIEKEPISLDGLNICNTVGINVSNLIVGDKNSKNYEMILRSYYTLMDYIISKTDMNIILIPHVMNNADLSILKILYEQFNNNNRIKLIENENMSAKQLKYIISECRFFIGARTHATIAAYSSCVPTLVLGYSIKSVGIARDLFTTDKNYVLSHKELKTEYDLLDGFKWLYKQENHILEQLKITIPNYIKKAWEVKTLINKFLSN